MFCFYRTAINTICGTLFSCGCGKSQHLIKQSGHLGCRSVHLLRYCALSPFQTKIHHNENPVPLFCADQAMLLVFLLIKKNFSDSRELLEPCQCFSPVDWLIFVFSWLYEGITVSISTASLCFLCCSQICSFLGSAKLSKTGEKPQ